MKDEELIYNIHHGDLASFAKWWNTQTEYSYNGKYRIVYVKHNTVGTKREHFVEYLIQLK